MKEISIILHTARYYTAWDLITVYFFKFKHAPFSFRYMKTTLLQGVNKVTSQVRVSHAENKVVYYMFIVNISCIERWKKSIEITCISCFFIYNIQIVLEKYF